MKDGPTVTTAVSCNGCRFHDSETVYFEDGNSDDYTTTRRCSHPTVGAFPKRIENSYSDETPTWCPLYPKDPNQ